MECRWEHLRSIYFLKNTRCRNANNDVSDVNKKNERTRGRVVKNELDFNEKASSNRLTERDAVVKPLVVSKLNPRYFTVKSDDAADQRAAYLIGSRIREIQETYIRSRTWCR